MADRVTGRGVEVVPEVAGTYNIKAIYIVFITDLSSEAGSFASVIIRPSTM